MVNDPASPSNPFPSGPDVVPTVANRVAVLQSAAERYRRRLSLLTGLAAADNNDALTLNSLARELGLLFASIRRTAAGASTRRKAVELELRDGYLNPSPSAGRTLNKTDAADATERDPRMQAYRDLVAELEELRDLAFIEHKSAYQRATLLAASEISGDHQLERYSTGTEEAVRAQLPGGL